MTRTPRLLDQFPTLVRTFFGRFFDNDVTGDARDVRTMFFAFLAVMAVPGVVVPFFLANQTTTLPGWDLVARDRGVDYLRAMARADKVFYLGYAMISAGVVSALTWGSLIVDRRDGLILGALPVRAVTIVGAKLVALAAFVAGVTAAIHVLASISFGGFLASHNTFEFALRGIAAHFIGSAGASGFVLFAAAAAQGLALVLMGPRRFGRVSPVLQVGLIGAILALTIALPTISGAVVATLGGATGAARLWILSTPPMWFLGLYEWVIGTDDPTLISLARMAGLALAVAVVTILVTYPLAYRRLMRTVVEQSDRPARLRASAALIELLSRALGRAPQIRAVVQFFVATLVRHQRQRLAVATGIGLAVVWGLPAWMSSAAASAGPDSGLLSWALMAPLFVAAGLRAAAALPADAGQAWVFRFLTPSPAHLRAAVERTILFVGIVPAIAPFSVAFWWLWGAEAAIVHTSLSLATAGVFLQGLLRRFDSVPCTCPWNPGAIKLRFWWPAYLAGFLFVSHWLPLLDLALIHHPLAGACVSAAVAWLAVRLRQALVARPALPTEEAAGVLAAALQARRHSRAAASTDDAGTWSGSPVGDAPAHALLHAGRTPDRWRRARDVSRDLAVILVVSPGVLRRDAALAIRRLRRAPMFTAFSVLTLAGGVAATTLAFAVTHALLWTRPPVADFDRLVDISGARVTGSRSTGAFSWPDFVDLSERQTTLSGLAVSTHYEVSFVGGQASAIVGAEAVNGDFFPSLGLRPAAGRLIEPADDRPGASPVVVLSYNLWRLRFQANPGVIGETVSVDGRPYHVVGVAPAGFNGVDFSNVGRAAAIWMPLHTASGDVPYFLNGEPQTVQQMLTARDREARWLSVKGTLAPGRRQEQASAEVGAIGRSVEESFPTPRRVESNIPPPRYGRRWSADPVDDDRPLSAGRLFIAIVGLVLLIAATNLANLALARGAARQHEFAVRRALGASRGDLIREQIMETAFVGLAAAGIAWLLVSALSRRLVMEVPGRSDQFLLLEPQVSGPVLVFAVMTGLAALAVAGLWPALQLTGSRLRSGLTAAGGATPLQWRFHHWMIRWQVAGSAAMLFLAAACLSALVASARHAPGVDIDRLAMAQFSLSANRHDRARARAVIDVVLSDVIRRPGVASAAASVELPFDGRRILRGWPITRTDEPLAPHGDSRRSVHVVAATPQIFRTLGVGLLRGRSFGGADTAATAPVGVINDAFAQRLWGTPDAVGRDLVLWTPAGQREASAPAFQRITIVGVASDTDAGRIGSREAGVMYVPMDQHPLSRVVFTVRASSDDAALALASLQAAIRQVAPDLVLGQTGTGSRLLQPGRVALSVVGPVVTSIGILAMLLAMTGLFGIMSELVSRRTREFGVRAALGASRSGIVRLVLLDGLKPVAGGLILGGFAGAVGRSAIAGLLNLPMPAVDPLEFGGVAVLMVAAAVGACVWPARRAAGVNPTIALRSG
jgi:predicted permease